VKINVFIATQFDQSADICRRNINVTHTRFHCSACVTRRNQHLVNASALLEFPSQRMLSTT
jgi:hypothetical protein